MWLRCIALFVLVLAAGPAGAQRPVPAALDLGASEGGYTDVLYPVGWSEDGTRLAVVTEQTGQSATANSLALRVHDLVTDAVLAELWLVEPEADEHPDLARVWAEQQAGIDALLSAHGIGAAAFRVETFPTMLGAMPNLSDVYGARVERTFGTWDGGYLQGVTAYRVVLRQSASGAEKTVAEREMPDYPPFGVSVIGLLRAPTGDRLVLLVKEARHGFEGDRVQSYRLFGAGVGERF